jgi:hypothetical protein
VPMTPKPSRQSQYRFRLLAALSTSFLMALA